MSQLLGLFIYMSRTINVINYANFVFTQQIHPSEHNVVPVSDSSHLLEEHVYIARSAFRLQITPKRKYESYEKIPSPTGDSKIRLYIIAFHAVLSFSARRQALAV
jgi:hypothetical protein